MASAVSVLGTGSASYITFVLAHVYGLLEIFFFFFFFSQTIASTHSYSTRLVCKWTYDIKTIKTNYS